VRIEPNQAGFPSATASQTPGHSRGLHRSANRSAYFLAVGWRIGYT
jgi:hypothetical protein